MSLIEIIGLFKLNLLSTLAMFTLDLRIVKLSLIKTNLKKFSL